MGLEAHACSLRVFVTLHVSGAVDRVPFFKPQSHLTQLLVVDSFANMKQRNEIKIILHYFKIILE